VNPGKILSSETDKPVNPRGEPRSRAPNNSVRNVALQQGLRAAYRIVIEEPLPDRLLALLQQLDGDGPTR
jgi:hypothetical protein